MTLLLDNRETRVSVWSNYVYTPYCLVYLIAQGSWELRSTRLGGNERHSITIASTHDDENRRDLACLYMLVCLLYNSCHVLLSFGICNIRTFCLVCFHYMSLSNCIIFYIYTCSEHLSSIYGLFIRKISYEHQWNFPLMFLFQKLLILTELNFKTRLALVKIHMKITVITIFLFLFFPVNINRIII